MLDTRIRPWTEGDREYVVGTWINSFACNPWVSAAKRRPRGPRDRAAQTALANVLLARSEVLIVCPVDHPSTVHAWICVEGDCMHWLYVRSTHNFKDEDLPRRLAKDCKTTTMPGKLRKFLGVDWLKYKPEMLK